MAKVTNVFLNGSIGNLVFYRRMGTNCARVKASHVAQSAATKMRSVNFGIAARAGKALRRGLLPCMPVATDRSMQSRFSGAIAKWLRISAVNELPWTDVVPFVCSLEFTKGQPIKEKFKVPLTFSQPKDDMIAISMDAFVPVKKIAAPAGTGLVTLVISAASCVLKTGMPSGDETHTIDIPFDDTLVASRVLEFHLGTSAQALLVIAARLIYKRFEYGIWVTIKKEAFIPAGVIHASYRS